MKNKISKEINRKNLLECANLLEDIDYCFFYGSLLGVYRDNDVIEGDDDVDILLSEEDDEKVAELLLQNGYKVSTEFNGQISYKGIFRQFYKVFDGVPTILDLYFYEKLNDRFIVEKWNFHGKPFNKSFHMLLPAPIIFPIKETIFKGKKIKIPNKPEKVCRYLYGENFSTPLKKELEYYTIIENNRPCIKLK